MALAISETALACRPDAKLSGRRCRVPERLIKGGRAILSALAHREERTWIDPLKATRLSKKTLNKHLSELGRKRLVIRQVDSNSEKYPRPVYYWSPGEADYVGPASFSDPGDRKKTGPRLDQVLRRRSRPSLLPLAIYLTAKQLLIPNSIWVITEYLE